MSKHIVTKDSLQHMLNQPNEAYVMNVVGRALLVLLDRQTFSEQNKESTLEDNGIGFTGADGRLGTKHAKYFKRFNKLDQWAVEMWLKKNERGYSRIAKYWEQLDSEAKKKQISKQQSMAI